MYYYEVAPNQIVRAGSDTFTYSSTDALTTGQLVTIEVGKKQCIGMVMHATKRPQYAVKPISDRLAMPPLPLALVELAKWMSTYYTTPLATTLQSFLPRGITKKRRARPAPPAIPALRDRTQIVLTGEQQAALTTVNEMSTGTALLHGVTGSGKTRIYIELATQTLMRGQSVIVLVPEIALTSQLVDEFSQHFSDIILTHSRQTEAERHLAWKEALDATEPRIAIGPRSALFLPLAHVGLIVVDEAHEPSFKQEQAPRYSALRAASILAHHHGANVILGSATPSVSDYYLATHSDRPIIPLLARAQKNAVAPTITLVDMTKRTNFKHHRFLSDALLAQLTTTFDNNKQALIFHNRRGSASTTLCENCGWSAMCERCFIPLTLHADKHHLRCHVCAATNNVPTSCPECGTTDIVHKGIGTKLIESELRKRFPNKKIMRFDGDSEQGESVEQQYAALYDGSIDCIIGTQVVAKGLDLPHLRTVGVIQADAGLSLPDFSASERTFQLLAQVIGRVGRSHHATDVVVQSYQPTHPAVVDGLSQNYEHFYTTTLEQRRRGNFPPFTYLLKLTCIYKTEAAAVRNAQTVMRTLRAHAAADVTILGPTPAFYERQGDTYRWQLVITSPKRAHLVTLMQYVPSTHWQSELDPTGLL